jgi:ribosomal protein L9
VIVTRLLLTPICHVAPPGIPGDVVRVSDGGVEIYLLPDEFAAHTEVSLRARLAQGQSTGCDADDGTRSATAGSTDQDGGHRSGA